MLEVVKAETLMELVEDEEEEAWVGSFNYSCSCLHTDNIIHHNEDLVLTYVE